MHAARGVPGGGDGGVGDGDHRVAIGEHARAAVGVGGDCGIGDGQRAAGGQNGRAHAVEAGRVAAGGVVGRAGHGGAVHRDGSAGDQQRVLIRAGGLDGLAGDGRVLAQRPRRVVGVGLAAHAAGLAAHAAGLAVGSAAGLLCVGGAAVAGLAVGSAAGHSVSGILGQQRRDGVVLVLSDDLVFQQGLEGEEIHRVGGEAGLTTVGSIAGLLCVGGAAGLLTVGRFAGLSVGSAAGLSVERGDGVLGQVCGDRVGGFLGDDSLRDQVGQAQAVGGGIARGGGHGRGGGDGFGKRGARAARRQTQAGKQSDDLLRFHGNTSLDDSSRPGLGMDVPSERLVGRFPLVRVYYSAESFKQV